jgi:histidinol-phosphate/aromatic aminotransferase/cobyric acid decarboxylase-like protein
VEKDDDIASFVLRRHAELEADRDDGEGGRFLSGWQCVNPWANEIRARIDAQLSSINATEYLYFDRDANVSSQIREFHSLTDQIGPDAIFCGAGSTALIFLFCVWLRQQSINEVFYLPPLYFTTHFALKLFDIRARPVSGRQAFEPDFSLNLPESESVLLVCDPVWYAGVPLDETVIETVCDWQRRTGSFVFVDGSFQYARWSGQRAEPTARLAIGRTVRLVCPTKNLATHGYRFAYALLPSRLRSSFAEAYSNIYGSCSVEDIAFARVAISEMIDGRITRQLMALVSERHRSLRARGRITAPWQPGSGYFVFERLADGIESASAPLMDGSFFEQKRFPAYRRINLLSPSVNLLD